MLACASAVVAAAVVAVAVEDDEEEEDGGDDDVVAGGGEDVVKAIAFVKYLIPKTGMQKLTSFCFTAFVVKFFLFFKST